MLWGDGGTSDLNRAVGEDVRRLALLIGNTCRGVVSESHIGRLRGLLVGALSEDALRAKVVEGDAFGGGLVTFHVENGVAVDEGVRVMVSVELVLREEEVLLELELGAWLSGGVDLEDLLLIQGVLGSCLLA